MSNEEFDSIDKVLIFAIEKQGYKYGKDTPECAIYLSEHPNCEGCPTAIACAKYCKLSLIQMIPIFYSPRDFEDFRRMQKRISELFKMVMDAQTEKELNNIPDF